MKNRFGKSHFNQSGYRFTESRTLIFNILFKTDKHLSADEIFSKIKVKYPGIGLATVYRNLEILQKLNIITKFDFGENLARYELTEDFSKKTHHHHLICKNCNSIFDYYDFIDDEVDLIKKLENKLSEKYKFKINNHRIEFYGLCDQCQKQKK